MDQLPPISGQMKPSPLPFDAPLIDGLTGGFALRVVADSRELNKGNHQHPHGELFLLRSGCMMSQSAEGHWLIPAGHLCWAPPFSIHGGGADMEFVRGTRIHLAPEFCDAMPARPGVFACNALIQAVIDRISSVELPRVVVSESEELLLRVLLDEIRQARSSAILLPMPKDPKIKRIAERWMQNPNDQAGLDELAEHAGLSRRTLTRTFKMETGLSVGQWRQLARLLRGFEMLVAGKSVTETAFSLGYDSTTSFVLLCQRHTGMSPKSLGRMFEQTAGQ